jgi:hypothetical protein
MNSFDIQTFSTFNPFKYSTHSAHSTMQRILFLFFIICATATFSFAQGELNIYADSIVSAMMRKHTTPIARGAKEIPAFRIQVAKGPSREVIMKRKAAFLAAYPDVRIDYSFNDPYHTLKAGAFPNRDDCNKWMDEHKFKASFPEALPIYDEHVRVKDLMDYLGIFPDEE